MHSDGMRMMEHNTYKLYSFPKKKFNNPAWKEGQSEVKF